MCDQVDARNPAHLLAAPAMIPQQHDNSWQSLLNQSLESSRASSPQSQLDEPTGVKYQIVVEDNIYSLNGPNNSTMLELRNHILCFFAQKGTQFSFEPTCSTPAPSHPVSPTKSMCSVKPKTACSQPPRRVYYTSNALHHLRSNQVTKDMQMHLGKIYQSYPELKPQNSFWKWSPLLLQFLRSCSITLLNELCSYLIHNLTLCLPFFLSMFHVL